MGPKRKATSPSPARRGGNPAVPNLFGGATATAVEAAQRNIQTRAVPPPATTTTKTKRASRGTPKRRKYNDDDDDDDDEQDEEEEEMVDKNKRSRANGTTPVPTPRKTTPTKPPSPAYPAITQLAAPAVYVPPAPSARGNRASTPNPSCSRTSTPTPAPAQASARPSTGRKPSTPVTSIYAGLTPGGGGGGGSDSSSASAGGSKGSTSTTPARASMSSSSRAPYVAQYAAPAPAIAVHVPRSGPFSSTPITAANSPVRSGRGSIAVARSAPDEPADPPAKVLQDYAPSISTSSEGALSVKDRLDDLIQQYGDYAVVFAVTAFLCYVMLYVMSTEAPDFVGSVMGEGKKESRASYHGVGGGSWSAHSFRELGSAFKLPIALVLALAAVYAIDWSVVRGAEQESVPRSTAYFNLSVHAASAVIAGLRSVASTLVDFLAAVSSSASSPEQRDAYHAPVPVRAARAGLLSHSPYAGVAGGGPVGGRPRVAFEASVSNPQAARSGSLSPQRGRPDTPHHKPSSQVRLPPAAQNVMLRLARSEHTWLLLLDLSVVAVIACHCNLLPLSGLVQRSIPFLYVPFLASLLLLHPALAWHRHAAFHARRLDALAEAIADVIKDRLVAGRPHPIDFLKEELLDTLKKKKWPAAYAAAETERGERHDVTKLPRSEFLSLWPRVLKCIAVDVRIRENEMNIEGFRGACWTLHKTTIPTLPFANKAPLAFGAFGGR